MELGDDGNFCSYTANGNISYQLFFFFFEEREAIWQHLLQVKTHISSDPASSLLGVHLIGIKVSEWKTSHRIILIAGWHSYVNAVLGGVYSILALTETHVQWPNTGNQATASWWTNG